MCEVKTATAYPAARRAPIVDRLHGRDVHDPYRWLEDPATAETGTWLAAQDAFWHEHAAALPGRAELRERIAALGNVGMISAPIWRGARRFFVRRTADQDHPVLYTADGDGTEAALVDPRLLAADGTVVLDDWQPDRSGRRLAFQVSRRGDERSLLFVLDVSTHDVLDGPIDRCRHTPVAWLSDGTAFYYVRARTDGVRRVYLHRVGTRADADTPIHDRDRTVAYGLAISADGRWLTISASPAMSAGNDLWLADLSASTPEAPSLVVVQQDTDAQTVANVGPDGRLYLVTTLDAPRGRLCVADPSDPVPARWRDLVRADDGSVLNDFAILDGPQLQRALLVVSWTRHAVSEVTVHDLITGERSGEIALPGLGSVGSLSTMDAAAHEVWFTYTDSITPAAVHRYDARSRDTALWARPPGSVGIPEARTREVVAISDDGTPVRVVVLARDVVQAGPRPTILYGYGGFGIPLTPTYSSFALAWVEAGGVFATAGVRGGGEGGAAWHQAGTLDRKQNVFDDFAAAARTLIDQGWTTSARLGICGESNGGLLVGATVTQHPDLAAAAVCSAPLLDMVRYERSGLGANWQAEFGSATDPEQLGWLLDYSPYHHVERGVDYPAVLFTVFDSDTRVDPLHARKMTAALQWATAGGRAILLRRESDVGHGARAVSRSVALAADMLAFLAAHTGLAL
jgi:prolyl oligopeptidase